MLTQERYNYILDMLFSKKTVRVSQLALALNVSSETIRRDLEYLEKECLLTRVHGGAALVRVDAGQGTFSNRLSRSVQEKEYIAKIAVEFISEGQTISLDHSTTCLALAREIKKRFKSLTIVTNSLEVLNTICDVSSFITIYLGGLYNYNEHACFGPHVIEMIRRFNTDMAFIGVGGISLKEGCTENLYDAGETLKAFLEVTQRIIIVADSSKFDVVTLMQVCKIEDVDTIITDKTLKPNVLGKYRNHGIEIVNEIPNTGNGIKAI